MRRHKAGCEFFVAYVEPLIFFRSVFVTIMPARGCEMFVNRLVVQDFRG